MTLSDLYMNLFGKGAITDGSVIDMAEHGRVGGVSTGQGFKYIGVLNASGSLVSDFGGSSSALATVTAIQGDAGTSPWRVTMGTLPVVITSPLPVTQLGAWSVTATVPNSLSIQSLPTLSVFQGTSPWLITMATIPAVITGMVTANAGTNLNTSLLALEAGGNLAAIKTKTDNLDVTLGSRMASGATMPITGTITSTQGTAGSSAWLVTQATLPVIAGQGGTWTIQPGNTPNTTAWLMTMATHPVISHQGVAGATAWLVTQATLPVIANINNATIAVTESGTWTVQPGNTPNTVGWLATLATQPVMAGQVGTWIVGGTVATNVAITANPLNLGAQAVSSENTAVTTARQVQLVADLVGKLIVLPYANPENFVSGAITSAMTGTTSTSLIVAPASGLRNYITQITVSNAHATVGTDIVIQDGSGGTTLYTIPAAAVYGGAAITLPTPLRQPTTATAIYCANVTTGASTKVSASGYKGA